MATDPINPTLDLSTASRVVVPAFHKDDDTGAVWVHKDLVKVQEAWAEEEHIGPPKVDERFGDVESWAKYVKRFSLELGDALVTWSSGGLRAVLDYHSGDGATGRCQWTATMPFERSPEWRAWMQLANGAPVAQRVAIEKLEDRAPDIVDPSPTELMALLRNLRATLNSTAQTELRPDGTTSVSYAQDGRVAARGGTIELPPEFDIAIPVLKGHVDVEGKAVVYKLTVRLRASLDDSAHLALRFSIPNAERTLEDVFADRVHMAERLLGDGFDVLRAAD